MRSIATVRSSDRPVVRSSTPIGRLSALDAGHRLIGHATQERLTAGRYHETTGRPGDRAIGRIFRFSIAFLLLLVSNAHGQSTIDLALEESPAPPWNLPDKSGLDVELVERAASHCGVTIAWQVLPWRRCLLLLESGRVDGLLDVSWLPERDVLAVWPRTAEGKLDDGCRLHTESYHLYRRRGDALGWDGTGFSGLRGAIANQPGFSIGAFLRGAGVTVDEEARDVESAFGKLIKGRVQGAALLTGAAEAVLAQREDLRTKVERVDPPLQRKAYFVVFSHDWYGRNQELAARLWQAVASERESPEWRARIDQALAGTH